MEKDLTYKMKAVLSLPLQTSPSADGRIKVPYWGLRG